jgi:predicted nucleic acid-binding protein
VSDVVIDASALVFALIGKEADAERLRQRFPNLRRHAPHLADAEVGNVLRRHRLAGLIDDAEASAALRAGGALIHYRYPHVGELAEAAWRLNDNLSFYDALYVALAHKLGLPLLTTDARLSRAPGVPCVVEVV